MRERERGGRRRGKGGVIWSGRGGERERDEEGRGRERDGEGEREK